MSYFAKRALNSVTVANDSALNVPEFLICLANFAAVFTADSKFAPVRPVDLAIVCKDLPT